MAENLFGYIDTRGESEIIYNATPLSTAPAFDTTTAYNVGDYCFYNGTLYRFVTAKSAGAWDASCVESAVIAEDVKKTGDEIGDLKNAISRVTRTFDNEAADMPGLPFTQNVTSSNNQQTLYNSFLNSGAYYVDLKTGKYYLSIIKIFIYSDDESTAGTLRLVLTKKDTSSKEPATVLSRKDVYLSSAEKGSVQYIYNIATVSENVSVYYKAVSYSSGTASRQYHIGIDEVCTFEFDTENEAISFVQGHLSEVHQWGWSSAIDLLARASSNILGQVPYIGKTCCVIGDSLSASYYDMWCSYFADKTGITLTNNSLGGTSVAVRSGRSDSFVERVAAITDQYDIFIIFGGMNDKDGVPIGTLSDTSTSTFYGAYKAILSDLQTRTNHPQVIMIAPYYNVDAILPYIDAIRDIADHYGVPLVDLAKISGVNPGTRRIYTRDWTHPNQLLCDRIRPQITRELVQKIIISEDTDPMPN